MYKLKAYEWQFMVCTFILLWIKTLYYYISYDSNAIFSFNRIVAVIKQQCEILI